MIECFRGYLSREVTDFPERDQLLIYDRVAFPLATA